MEREPARISGGLQAIEKVLAPGFLGIFAAAGESRIVRPGAASKFAESPTRPQPTLGPDAFLQELRSALSSFSKIVTAEFQVTRIDAQPDGRLADSRAL